MNPFGAIVGYVVTDFKLGFGQAREAVAVVQFGFEAAPERFGVCVVVAIPASAHALQRAVLRQQVLEMGGGILSWSECTMSPA